MGEPTRVKVRVPVVDFKLGVAHVQKSHVFLDRSGANRRIRQDCHVDHVSERSMEVSEVSSFGAIGQLSIEADVVRVAIHPTVPGCEGHFCALLALKSSCCTSGDLVSQTSVRHVVDVHEEHVISAKHTIGC